MQRAGAIWGKGGEGERERGRGEGERERGRGGGREGKRSMGRDYFVFWGGERHTGLSISSSVCSSPMASRHSFHILHANWRGEGEGGGGEKGGDNDRKRGKGIHRIFPINN